MQLRHYLTDYDDELSGDSYVDPLGVLVIWSAFGQEIFRNRVNSISNDVRNYTLNLLHHGLIRDICNDDGIRFGKVLIEQVGDRHSLALRQACLVYLENVFTYSLVAAPASANVDSQGVLGASKARARLEQDDNPFLRFSHKKDAHLLIRQLGLGVSGRYKTPFMQMGFFNGSYKYDHDLDAIRLWDKAYELFRGRERLHALYQEARAHLVEVIEQFTRNGGTCLEAVPASLRGAYQQALPTPGQVGELTRNFWLEITGLNTGAAGALLAVLDEQAQKSPASHVPIQQLFARAEDRCQDPVERQKLAHVQILEPLLAEADLLLTLARHSKSQSLAEVEAHWQSLGRDTDTLPRAASRIEALPALLDTPAYTGRRRLGRLLNLARSGAFADQLRGLLDYHASVMRERGQQPWLQLEQLDRIKVNARTTPLPEPESWPPQRWVNHYYVPQFNNLVTGYRGGQA